MPPRALSAAVWRQKMETPWAMADRSERWSGLDSVTDLSPARGGEGGGGISRSGGNDENGWGVACLRRLVGGR